MKALTFTIIAGNIVCPNRCSICISRMTPSYGIDNKEPDVNWEKFDKAVVIARNHGAENVLITGKGEPTLYPGQIARFLMRLKDKGFDRIELQTEGSRLSPINDVMHDGSRVHYFNEFLDVWKDLGLDTIAISIYHYDSDINNKMFWRADGYDLWETVRRIQQKGYNVRLSCVMLKNGIDDALKVATLVKKAKEFGVFQLTLREADKPVHPLNLSVAKFVEENRIPEKDVLLIKRLLEDNGSICDVLAHGATTYEYDGQNVCLTTGLSSYCPDKDIRQLIFFPQGWLTTSWENVMGGRIL